MCGLKAPKASPVELPPAPPPPMQQTTVPQASDPSVNAAEDKNKKRRAVMTMGNRTVFAGADVAGQAPAVAGRSLTGV